MQQLIALALLGLGSLITAVDFTIVYVALPQIAHDLGFSPYALQWVVSAYAVPFGGFLLLGGRLSDLLGRRRMFVLGMALYGSASLLGGLATTPALLIAARALQGIGGALLMPATLSLVVTTFAEGPIRNRAMTVWAACGAAGLSAGALLGGVLTGAYGWSAVFYVNVPLAVIGGLAAFAVLPADPARRSGRIDVPGAFTATAGVTGLVFAISRGGEAGWTSPSVAGTLAVALLLLVAFVVIEARSRHPLMPLRLLGNRNTSAAALAILAYGLTLQCVPYFLTLHFQGTLGYDALHSGLAFLGPTLGITAGNLASERLIRRVGIRGTLAISLLVGAVGTAILALSLSAHGGYLGLLAGLAGYGLGAGLTFNTVFILAPMGVAAHEQGVVSGLSTTILNAATAIGLAVLVAVADRTGIDLPGSSNVDGLRTAVLVAAGGILAGVVSVFVIPAGRRASAPVR